MEALHGVSIDVAGDRLAHGVADGDRARIVHAAPDPGVVPVRARLRDAGVRAVRLSGVVSVNVCSSSKWLRRTVAAAPFWLGCPAGYSGCDGVLTSGSQSGSGAVSGLPSVFASGIAVTGRQVTSIGLAP